MTPRMRFGAFELDTTTDRLSGPGIDIALPDISARVLKVLIAHAPETVSAQTLADEAWGQSVVTEDTLTQRIKLLRQAFGETAQDACVIVTVRGKGYRLGLQVKAARPQALVSPVRLVGAGVLLLVLAVAGALVTINPAPVEPENAVEIGAPAGEVDLMLRRARTQMAQHRPQQTLRAVALLREAHAMAPERADVAVALSIALSTEVTKFSNDQSLITEAEALARDAVDLDDTDGNAWSALGYALDSQGRVSEAIAAYQQAVNLNPSDVNAMSSAAYLLAVRGRSYDALKLDMRALQLGGGPIYTELQIASTLDLLGERALADLWLERALRVNPEHPVITRGAAQIDMSRGEDASALARLQSLPESQRAPDHQTLEGWLALRAGDAEQARQRFEASGAAWEQAIMRAAATGEAGPPIYGWPGDTWPGGRVRAAEMAVAAGQIDNGFARLEEAVNLGWRDWGALVHSPMLAALQTDPRWQALQARIEREVTAQRALLESDAELRSALNLPAP